MKNNQIILKNEKFVLQVFHNYYSYTKDQKSFTDRKKATEWKTDINSRSGFLIDNKLVVSEKDKGPDLYNCNLIILNDYNSDSENDALVLQYKRWNKDLIEAEEKPSGQIWRTLKNIQYLNLIGSSRKFLIFRLSMADSTIELHLEYDYYEIGQPKRENFKLCNLELGVPIEIKINGKLDHSLSRGRERTFNENVYIFHLIGKTNTIEFDRNTLMEKKKKIPIPQKTIDLMKELY
ncbi:hypothetical protein [uncultured Acetobacteroides sp.]|uniref:hypothetical protein n=1 Tax=uncultured Acetobacteroides sp. TaxID=1760811 RepID=UPI0029F529AA|nr:hypothetical protein [uncultured Acetobacteroides sp.]